MEVAPRKHIFGMQQLDEVIATDSRDLFINLHHHILVVVPLRAIECDKTDPRRVPQVLPVAGMISPVDVNELLEAFQAREAHRRSHLAHLAVRAQ